MKALLRHDYGGCATGSKVVAISRNREVNGGDEMSDANEIVKQLEVIEHGLVEEIRRENEFGFGNSLGREGTRRNLRLWAEILKACADAV